MKFHKATNAALTTYAVTTAAGSLLGFVEKEQLSTRIGSTATFWNWTTANGAGWATTRQDAADALVRSALQPA